MAKTKPDDAAPTTCPQCGGPLAEARAATDAEYAAFTHKTDPASLPPGVDTAAPAQRAKLGPLFECGRCGYSLRVAPTAADAGAATASA